MNHASRYLMEPALDKNLFRTVVRCLGVRVRSQDVTQAQKALGKQALLSIRKIRSIVKDGDDHRVLLLDPEKGPKSDQELKGALTTVPFETRQEQIEVNYEHLQADEILRKLLPQNVEVPSGFETVGHIAHLNLRPEHEPFKCVCYMTTRR